MRLFSNNAIALISVGCNNTTDFQFTVETGKGDLFPVASGTNFFKVTLQDSSNNVEVWKITSRGSGSDVLSAVSTANRAQDGTTKRAFVSGDVVELRMVADDIEKALLMVPTLLSKSVAGSGDVTLSTDEQRRRVLEFTGVLTGNRNVIVDDTVWDWIVYNNTSGAFSLTVKTAAGTGVVVPQGKRSTLYNDGTNIGSQNTLVSAKGDLIVGTAADTVARKAVGANQTIVEADSTQADGLVWANRPDFGQAQLTYTDTTHIKLIPFNGNKLVVNGVVCTVPDAGATYAISGLASSTLYYVYATATAGVIDSTLTLSTTAPIASTATANKGTMIKTGTETQSLVGMVRTDGSTLFADTDAQRFVLSWFNDVGLGGTGVLGSDVALSVSGGPWAKVSNNVKREFLAWGGQVGHADISASWVDNTGGAGQLFYACIALNNEVSPGGTPYAIINYDTVGYYKNSATTRTDKLAVGYNYYVMLYIIGGGSTPFLSSASGISYRVGK